MKIKHIGLLLVAFAMGAPAVAQVATVPAPSFAQGLTKDTTLSVSVTLFGYTTRSQIPHLLTRQTVKLPPVSLLQQEVRVEFPGYERSAMTVMQMVVKTTAESPTFQSTTEAVTPKQPVKITVPAGQKLWVVYSQPTGQQAKMRFYVGTPPPTTTAAVAKS
jgi:hypothetical protein